MSQLHLSKSGQTCVDAKHPTAEDVPEDYFIMKIGSIFNKEWNKFDIGYSAIGIKHGELSKNGRNFGGIGIAYFNVDDDPDPIGGSDPGGVKLNFFDQQVFEDAAIILLEGGNNSQGGFIFDIALAWDPESSTYKFNGDLLPFELLKRMIGATVPFRVSLGA